MSPHHLRVDKVHKKLTVTVSKQGEAEKICNVIYSLFFHKMQQLFPDLEKETAPESEFLGKKHDAFWFWHLEKYHLQNGLLFLSLREMLQMFSMLLGICGAFSVIKINICQWNWCINLINTLSSSHTLWNDPCTLHQGNN